MHALTDIGVQLAIDDFGTGYSSLSYLKQFPVDTLKSDRSFVEGLGADPQVWTIVRTIGGLARALNLSVTGEGVETATQHAQLRELGCDRGRVSCSRSRRTRRKWPVYLRGSSRRPLTLISMKEPRLETTLNS